MGELLAEYNAAPLTARSSPLSRDMDQSGSGERGSQTEDGHG